MNTLPPSLFFIAYLAMIPCFSYPLPHIHHHRFLLLSIFFMINIPVLYIIMSMIVGQISTHTFFAMGMTGGVPFMKLIAISVNVLPDNTMCHIRHSFVDYCFYLILPFEVVFSPEKGLVEKSTKIRLIRGTIHMIFLIVFNSIVAQFSISQYNIVIRGFLAAVQIAVGCTAFLDIFQGIFGLFIDRIYLKDSFNLPYLSESPKDFWAKRWNLIMHTYLYRLFYIPLGGKNNQFFAVVVIYITMGLMHEMMVWFVSSAKYGYWTSIFVMHMIVMMAQFYSEAKFPQIMAKPSSKIALRMITMVIMMITADMAYKGSGMSVENVASSFNSFSSPSSIFPSSYLARNWI
eukprot:TRINITY_DN6159_c0_g1_i1.p1 TRINITY_DN6159_c0_g1~~TRINITY_DN6159_c0_g1_i1.p1  ORF type:complete len:346 (-),score=47.57 TRINITY_DN6159_c0_g1_i1:63-1100(-)